jgi:hypothetical protein
MSVINNPGGSGGGGMAIGSPVAGGTFGSVLYVDLAGNLAQENTNFYFDFNTHDLRLGDSNTGSAIYYTKGVPGLFQVHNASGNNWFEGNAGNFNVTGSGNFGTGDGVLGSLTTGSSNVGLGGVGASSATAASISTGTGNLAIGASALAACTSGNHNFAVGSNTLAASNDSSCLALGNFALQILGAGGAGGGGNTNVFAIGTATFQNLSTGNTTMSLGPSAGQGLTTSVGDVLIGPNAGANITAAANNTIIGTFAGSSLTGTCGQNTLIGRWAGPAASVSNIIGFSDGNSTLLQDWNYITASIWSHQKTTNPVGIHIYNTLDSVTAPTNYERAALSWLDTSNVFRIESQAAGTGVARLIAIDGFSKAGAPAAGGFPSGTWALINDTSGNQTWLAYNNAGTIRKVQLT